MYLGRTNTLNYYITLSKTSPMLEYSKVRLALVVDECAYRGTRLLQRQDDLLTHMVAGFACQRHSRF